MWGERSRHWLSVLGHFDDELASAFAGDESGECCGGIAEWVHVVDPRRDGALGDEGGHRLELGSRPGDDQDADSLSRGTSHQRAGDRGAQQDPGQAADHRVPPAAPQGAVHAER
ncbi:hypothetical protein Pve01_80950 [Planomonospora venezuelensis]|nr:hypothetical protein Pve01_80950 [Planomonospora venezuelensis]